MFVIRTLTFICLFTFVLVGCVERPTGVPISSKKLTKAEEKQLEEAKAAKKTLFEQLLGRLEKVMQTAGPANAIAVCQTEAPLIAKDVGKKQGVKIGRTSFKLRNPKNAPPRWTSRFVKKKTNTEEFVRLGGGTLGVLMPIFVQEKCLTCHGPKEQIPADVQKALTGFYPEDHATGFEKGDLRGWFWVEVPR